MHRKHLLYTQISKSIVQMLVLLFGISSLYVIQSSGCMFDQFRPGYIAEQRV